MYAVSNSSVQKAYIEAAAKKIGLTNVVVETVDAHDFEAERESFDRIVSVEMLEHVKNYGEIFARMSTWLKPNGLVFLHVFVHHESPYHFEDGWMARTFFSGGQMPSNDLFLFFQDHLKLSRQWAISGTQYAKTSEEWLKRCDAHEKDIVSLFDEHYGERSGYGKWNEWRLFFLAVAEMFNMNNGNTWHVSHYLFEK